MAIIKNKEDWINEAKQVAPMMPEYMLSQSGNIDPSMVDAEMTRLINEEDWKMLHRRFEEIWSWLPDSPSIRSYPFGRLCDLCSESWALYEEEQ